MAQADYIGAPAVLAAVKKQKNFFGLTVKSGTKKPFSVTQHDGYDIETMTEALEDYLQTRLDANANDATLLELLIIDDKGKVKQNFAFILNNSSVTGKEKTPSTFFAEQNQELGYLRAENKNLKNQIADLQNQVLELEAENEEATGTEIGGTDFIGAIKAAAMPYLPMLLEGLAKTFAPRQPIAVNGIQTQPEKMDINEILNELQRHDKDIVQHLAKLLSIAQTKPKTFAMLIDTLENF